jgi:hypothetical protein
MMLDIKYYEHAQTCIARWSLCAWSARIARCSLNNGIRCISIRTLYIVDVRVGWFECFGFVITFYRHVQLLHAIRHSKADDERNIFVYKPFRKWHVYELVYNEKGNRKMRGVLECCLNRKCVHFPVFSILQMFTYKTVPLTSLAFVCHIAHNHWTSLYHKLRHPIHPHTSSISPANHLDFLAVPWIRGCPLVPLVIHMGTDQGTSWRSHLMLALRHLCKGMRWN